MPHANRVRSPWIGNGNPDTFHEPVSTTPGAHSPYAPGDLGQAFDYADRTYQKIQLDSGATANTPVGAVAANQLAFWKDEARYRVTNDKRFAVIPGNPASNYVAGIFRHAVTAGHQAFILIRGQNIAVDDDGGSAVGETLYADTTASTCRAASNNVGVASIYKQIGVVRVASANNVCYADVDIPNIP